MSELDRFAPGNRRPASEGGEPARASFRARLAPERARAAEYASAARQVATIPAIASQLAKGRTPWVHIECHAPRGFHRAGARVRLLATEDHPTVDVDADLRTEFAVVAESARYAFQCTECGRRHELRAIDMLERIARSFATPTRVGNQYITRVQ